MTSSPNNSPVEQEKKSVTRSFYDYLKSAATLKKLSKIAYLDWHGAVKYALGIIDYLHIKKGEEFIQLDDGKVIPLDSILKFNGKRRVEMTD